MKKLDIREMRMVEAGAPFDFIFNISNDTITAGLAGLGLFKVFFEYIKIGAEGKKFPIFAYIQKIAFFPKDRETGLFFSLGKHWTDDTTEHPF